MKRTKNEVKNLKNKCDKTKFLMLNPKNIKQYDGFIQGPEDSVYKDYLFEIVVRIDDKFPFKAPVVYFKTQIFHPNIHFDTGEVCLDIIKSSWKPVYNLVILLDCLKDLLRFPNADSPLNCDAGI